MGYFTMQMLHLKHLGKMLKSPLTDVRKTEEVIC